MIHKNPPFIHSFSPVYTDRARILILGSMPGVKSLEEQAYYAHPRNGFWPIMENLFSVSFDNYESKIAFIKHHDIALWDVVSECVRPGSLDSRIESKSVTPNDIPGLLRKAPNIKAVFFNGQAAAKLYKKHLGTGPEGVVLQPLPSTSPAHAAMTFENKLEQWKQILTYLT